MITRDHEFCSERMGYACSVYMCCDDYKYNNTYVYYVVVVLLAKIDEVGQYRWYIRVTLTDTGCICMCLIHETAQLL